tara:strand:+ start:14616 stop:14783 length:168 start_codon:yes stop_codon:yes gene_type:complete
LDTRSLRAKRLGRGAAIEVKARKSIGVKVGLGKDVVKIVNPVDKSLRDEIRSYSL